MAGMTNQKVTPTDVTGRQHGSASDAQGPATPASEHPELHAFEVGEVVDEGYSVAADRQHYDITVPPRTAVHVAPGVTIHLHRDHPTDVTVMHTSELTKLIDGPKSSAD